MENICITKGEIPQGKGRLPAYATTFLVCVDDVKECVASGEIWSFCRQKPIAFNGFGNLLLMVDQLLDEIGQPERWRDLRTVTHGKIGTCRRASPELCYTPDELKNVCGKKGTAAIRIYKRQNASMQGELRLLNSTWRQVNFRSALELLSFMQEWVEKSADM